MFSFLRSPLKIDDDHTIPQLKRDYETIVYLKNKTQISVFSKDFVIEDNLIRCRDMLDKSSLLIPLTSVLYIEL